MLKFVVPQRANDLAILNPSPDARLPAVPGEEFFRIERAEEQAAGNGDAGEFFQDERDEFRLPVFGDLRRMESVPALVGEQMQIDGVADEHQR